MSNKNNMSTKRKRDEDDDLMCTSGKRNRGPPVELVPLDKFVDFCTCIAAESVECEEGQDIRMALVAALAGGSVFDYVLKNHTVVHPILDKLIDAWKEHVAPNRLQFLPPPTRHQRRHYQQHPDDSIDGN